MKRITIAATILLATVACGKKDNASAVAAPAPSAQGGAAAPAAANQLAGKVVETFNGGGYTYLRIATSSGEQWAAVRETKIAKGDSVTVDAQMTMDNFESTSLARTFDRIAFGSIVDPSAAAKPMGMPPQMASASGGTPSQHMQSPSAEAIAVERAPGGKTVAELWAEKSALNGKEIVVRGKVVKFLPGIMSRNWMHLQDGTGSADKGDNDITVTTDEKVNVGDVVTVKGTLAAGKDFGAGYLYEVIIEKATVR